MSREFYLLMHLTGIFMILLPLGGMALHILNGGTRDYPNRRTMALIHGVGMLLTFVAGFGLMARLGLMGGWPTWITAKLLIWLSLGVLPAFIYRRKQNALALFFTIIILASLAVSMAVFKPGTSAPASEAVELEPGNAAPAPPAEEAAMPAQSDDPQAAPAETAPMETEAAPTEKAAESQKQ